MDYTDSTTTISATWSDYSDAESAIDHYILYIYRTPLGSDITQLIHSDLVYGLSYTGHTFSLSNGDMITVTVEAVNGAGLSANASSDGYIIDLTPPQTTFLYDGVSDDIDYSIDASTYGANWMGYDDESDIAATNIALFMVSEGQKIRIFPDPALEDETTRAVPYGDTSYDIPGLLLLEGHRYYVAVTFTNGAGRKATYETNGLVIDTTPPVVDMVTVYSDGYLDDNDDSLVVANQNQVRLRWHTSDSGSGTVQHTVAIVTSDDNIVGEASFGAETEGVGPGVKSDSG